MKKLLLLAFMLGYLNVYAQTGSVKLTGVLKNFNNQVDINDHSETKDLSLPGGDRIIIPDSTGNFTISFKLAKPQYFKLGRNVLYLSPGDDMQVVVDYKDPEKASFSGKGAAQNSYLKATPFPKGGSFLNAGSNIKKDIPSSIDYIITTWKTRESGLMGSALPAAFKRLESARLRADAINSLANMKFYYPYRNKIKGDSVAFFEKDYTAVVIPEMKKIQAGFIEADYLQLEVYRDIVDGLLATNVALKESNKDYAVLKDWVYASNLVDSLRNTKERAAIKAFNTAVAKISVPTHRAAVEKVYQQLNSFGNGDTAVDFIALDPQGKTVNLKEFAGKIIYIDLWATWCGPCQDELKHLEVLKDKFKDDKNVAIVSLSIDDDTDLWKKSLATRNAGGIQLLINRSKLKEYSVVTIPRTIVVDKDFRILQMNGFQPSDKKTENYLKELSGK